MSTSELPLNDCLFVCLFCLFICMGFSPHSIIFQSYGDITIAGNGLQILKGVLTAN